MEVMLRKFIPRESEKIDKAQTLLEKSRNAESNRKLRQKN